MKKWFIYFIIMLIIANLAACKTASNQAQEEEPQFNKMKIQIGSTILTATLENNASADALKELLREAPLTIQFSQY